MDTEIIATTAVKERLALCDGLQSFINERDKEPLWDGHIYVFQKDNNKKENLIGRVSVQVKGKEKDVSKETTNINYEIEVTSLKKYLQDGGLIYFVVVFSENGEKNLFYKILLPFDIQQILKDNKIDETIEEHLLHILSHRKSNFADDYFKELLFDNNRVKFRPYVYIYYANAGIENYFDVIIDFLNECKISKSVLNVGGGLYQILDTIYKISKDTFVKILNNIEIVDLMDEKELMSFRDSLKGFQYKKGIYKNYLSLINETYLMTK